MQLRPSNASEYRRPADRGSSEMRGCSDSLPLSVKPERLSGVKHSFHSTTIKNPQVLVAVEAVEKVGIQRLMLDFQDRWESPGFGLFHRASFSTAFRRAFFARS